ncbi:RagB/SusD family nutrient uptake outer membrane protein [Albibacterium indicum]|uniref:RagB/SusD family nutrient uptake outer membrane protein n=1 Tax=Albibacterium indicum TaxID=2292082 RepID=UPI0013EEF3FF|nr:RagB/SusD family nutrient uptake outer membrane protein [Pedobacter indicus]
MKNTYIGVLLGLSIVLSSCADYLGLKPDDSFMVPSTLEDLQGLLDNSDVAMTFSNSGMGEIASDSYFLREQSWAAMSDERDRQHYLWLPASPVGGEWSSPYRAIMYANTVLTYLPEIDVSANEQTKANRLKGAALFYRSNKLFNLLQVFAKPYDPNITNNQLGIPLRVKATLDEELKRSTVEECYAFIINDLKQAIPLLSDREEIPTRPSKVSAYAEMARVYLVMGDHEKAGLYADSALSIHSELLDYEVDIDLEATVPFDKWTKEVLLDAALRGGSHLSSRAFRVSPFEYNNYEDEDLRKEAFFSFDDQGDVQFKGSYNGRNSVSLFMGTTTAEMYLIRAEANARKGLLDKAAEDLNHLRSKRFRDEDFITIKFGDQKQALEFIKRERRRELIFRGVRWTDMRRYIILGEFDRSMTRNVDGEEYILTADDIVNYVFKIPEDVIEYSNLEQN